WDKQGPLTQYISFLHIHTGGTHWALRHNSSLFFTTNPGRTHRALTPNTCHCFTTTQVGHTGPSDPTHLLPSQPT
ncbi:hypothetical protein NDU88_007353, partial [Pleurodeles waltl]